MLSCWTVRRGGWGVGASVTCEFAYSIRMGTLAMRETESIARRRASLWLWTDCVKPLVVWEEDESVAANQRLALCENNS